MTIASISPLRLPLAVSAARRRFFSVVAGRHQSPNNVSRKLQQPNKNLLKAWETISKHFSTLAPILSHENMPRLSHDQAVGTVASSQANFMRVIVQLLPPQETFTEASGRIGKGSGEIGVELLCVEKAVLKKIKRRVLVGDKVLVGSIDWVDRRGAIENVFQRKSEILDPPVANVDHLLVLFSLDQPKV